MTGFTEVREADAPPAIAAIYSEIKTLSGLPLVNLIWRHFAALPGALPWAWEAVRPLVASRSMDEARRRLADAIVLPPAAAVDWRSALPKDGDIERVLAIVDAYSRGNLTNLLALTALRLRLEQPSVAPEQLLPASMALAAPKELDPLPGLAELTPDVAAQVRALAARHGGPPDIIPSLYLHLAHWPRLLEVLPGWLTQVYAPGVLEELRGSTRRLAEAEAVALLPAATRPPPSAEPAVKKALAHFTGQVIPDLLPVCLALAHLRPRSLLPAK